MSHSSQCAARWPVSAFMFIHASDGVHPGRTRHRLNAARRFDKTLVKCLGARMSLTISLLENWHKRARVFFGREFLFSIFKTPPRRRNGKRESFATFDKFIPGDQLLKSRPSRASFLLGGEKNNGRAIGRQLLPELWPRTFDVFIGGCDVHQDEYPRPVYLIYSAPKAFLLGNLTLDRFAEFCRA